MKRILPLLLAAVGALAAADKPTVTVFMYSEYIDPAIPKAFEAATGHPVNIQVYEAQEDMLAKLRTGGTAQYDVVVATDVVVPQLINSKLVQPLDAAQIPNAKNVDAKFHGQPCDPKNVYSQPYLWGSIGILYNITAVKSKDAVSWKLLLDPAAQPGPFVFMDEVRSMMGVTLLANGKDINSHVTGDIKAAAETLIAAKGSTKCLGFEGGVGGKNKVVGGQAVAAVVYSGDAARAIVEGKDLAYAIPVEGSNLWVDNMLVTVAAPNKAGAHAFINFILDAKIGAQNANFIQYPTPNAASLPLIKPEDRANTVIYPDEASMKRLYLLSDLGNDTKTYDAAWTMVKSR